MKRWAILGVALALALTPATPETAASVPITPAVLVDIVKSAAPGAGPVIVLDLPYAGHERLVRHPRAELIEYPGMEKRFR